MSTISGVGSQANTLQLSGFGQVPGLFKSAMDAAAQALNLKPDQLKQQLQSGKSLKDISSAQGVDFATVQSAMTDAVKPQLAQAVQSGQLTDSQAQKLLSKLTSGDAVGKAHHGHHHHQAGPAPSPAARDATGGSSSSTTLEIMQLNISITYSSSGSVAPTGSASSAPSGQTVNATA